jgi:hypothetical protein
MDNQQSTKMPKPFDSDHALNASTASGQQPNQFELREDDHLKQEEEYRQGKLKSIVCHYCCSACVTCELF